MKDLIIVGAGGFGREVNQWVKDVNKVEKKWNVLGFIDDTFEPLAGHPCDIGVIGKIIEWEPKENEEFICAIADPDGREKVVKSLKARGAKFTNLIHPTAYVADFAEIGEGLILCPGTCISVNTKVGNYVILQGSCIGHDAVVGNFCTISALCQVSGYVTLEDKVFLGTNVVVIPHKKVGAGAYAAAGSVIVSNVKSGYHVMGNPAMRMEF